jgi:hypothetical protein
MHLVNLAGIPGIRSFLKEGIMHRVIKNWGIGLAVIFLLGGLGLSAVQAEDVCHFTQVEGQVEVVKKGVPTPVAAKVETGVAEGDTVQTKAMARAQLKFVDDSTITLAPDTKITIESYMFDASKGKRRAVTQMTQGLVHAVVSQVQKVAEPDFLIKTPTAVMGVKGTEWYVMMAKQGDEGCEEEVEPKKSKKTVPFVPDITFCYVKSGNISARSSYKKIAGEASVKGFRGVCIPKAKPPGALMVLTGEDFIILTGLMSTGVPNRPVNCTNPKEMLRKANAMCTPLAYTPAAEQPPAPPSFPGGGGTVGSASQ